MARGGARSGAGRRRKDPDLKVLAGTDRADRDGAKDLPAPAGAMICPAHLSELAAMHFAAIARMLEDENRSSPHYAEHVGLLALRLEQIQRYNAVLEVEGDTYTTESAKKVDETLIVTRMIRARPEVAMLSEAMRQAQSLIGELMLNPSAALRIAAGHKEDPGAFEGF